MFKQRSLTRAGTAGLLLPRRYHSETVSEPASQVNWGILLPFSASTFSCFPFLYSFLRFFILKKRQKCFEEIVTVDRGLTNQVPETVRIPGDPPPSHRPRGPAEAVRASR